MKAVCLLDLIIIDDMLKLLISIFFSLLSLLSDSKVSAQTQIELVLSEASLVTSISKLSLNVTMQCRNNSESNLILYGFQGNHTKFGATRERACDLERVGGGMAIIILDEQGSRVSANWRISDSLDYEHMSQAKFDRLMHELSKKYLEGTLILNKGELVVVKQTIDLKEFSLKKGIYELQLIYYSGKRLEKKTVGIEQIRKDERNYDADLFQGCVTSNILRFEVF